MKCLLWHRKELVDIASFDVGWKRLSDIYCEVYAHYVRVYEVRIFKCNKCDEMFADMGYSDFRKTPITLELAKKFIEDIKSGKTIPHS